MQGDYEDLISQGKVFTLKKSYDDKVLTFIPSAKVAGIIGKKVNPGV
jgi:hypothetical protein